MSLPAGLGGGITTGGPGDKSLRFGLADTFKLAWADEDLRVRLKFVLLVFVIYAFCIHVPVPIPGADPSKLADIINQSGLFSMINAFGGGALKKISILALGLNPYITSSIIMQILMAANPAWKKEMQEDGEAGRTKNAQRTRILSLFLSVGQGLGLLAIIGQGIPLTAMDKAVVLTFWTAGSMFLLWLGEQITERGIGNGMSLLIFCGIVISFPDTIGLVVNGIRNGTVSPFAGLFIAALFLLSTWFVVYFTIAQRRIPIQHTRRNVGTRAMPQGSNYLPFSVVMVGVIPIIFAVSLIYIPAQLAGMFGPPGTPAHDALVNFGRFMQPDFTRWQGWVGALFYTALIFFFSYFYTAIQFNVEDIANNLKRSQATIPGIRPGKQTQQFLDGVISRITVVGAFCLAIVALSQYVVPLVINIASIGLLFGTSLLIMVSVALETMRQIEAHILMSQYGGQ